MFPSNFAERRTRVIPVLLVVLSLACCAKGPTDDSISQGLKAGFFSDPQLKNEAIQVAVNNGEVTLGGEVSSDGARLQAYKLANEIPGVRKVIDSMTVRSASSTPAAAPPPRVEKQTQSTSTPGQRSPLTDKAKPAEGAGNSSDTESARAVATTSSSSTPPALTAPPPKAYTIPAGTDVRIQMIDAVNSKNSKVGSTFQASLYAPITVGNEVVIPAGADVFVRLVSAKSAGKITGQSELELELDHIQLQGKTIPLKSSTYQQAGESRGKQTATRTALGTGIGAAIGAIAGGGKGAAIGAAIGAGGGMATQILTHGKEVQVPAETKLDFKLSESFDISLQSLEVKKSGTRTPVPTAGRSDRKAEEPRPKEEF